VSRLADLSLQPGAAHLERSAAPLGKRHQRLEQRPDGAGGPDHVPALHRRAGQADVEAFGAGRLLDRIALAVRDLALVSLLARTAPVARLGARGLGIAGGVAL